MKTNRKIVLDKYFGRPVVILMNVLARLLGLLLNRNHHLKGNTHCICICKFVGMGSIIQSTPLITTLRQNYPGSKLIYLTSASNRGLIEKIKALDAAIYIDDSGLWKTLLSTVQAFFRMRNLKPSCFIDLEIYSNYSTIISTLSCANNRLGFFRKDSAILMGIYTHMLSFNINAPVAHVYLQMARLLGCEKITYGLYEFEVKDNHGLQKLKDLQGQPYIVVNPNASDLRIERRWNKQSFVSLIKGLLEQCPENFIVLIGAANEREYVTGLTSEINSERLVNSSGLLNLDELFGLIRHCSLMITNDTGPMHVAFALKTRTIGLFGPCSPVQYGHFENAWCVYKRLYCSPCVHEFLLPPCGGDNQCMKLITADEVLQLALQLLKTGNTTVEIPVDLRYAEDESHFPYGLVRRAT